VITVTASLTLQQEHLNTHNTVDINIYQLNLAQLYHILRKWIIILSLFYKRLTLELKVFYQR